MSEGTPRPGIEADDLRQKRFALALLGVLVLLLAASVTVILATSGGGLPRHLADGTSTEPSAAALATASPTPSASRVTPPPSGPPESAAPSPAPSRLPTIAPTQRPPTPGDDIANPIAVNGLPLTIRMNAAGATIGATDADCAGTGPSVWFLFQPTVSQAIAATTFGSNYDTTIAVATSTDDGLTWIACNDDVNGSHSAVRFEAMKGATYLIMVGSFDSSAAANLVFNLRVAPPPLAITVVVDEVGTYDEEGRATVSGVISCSVQAKYTGIEVSVRQTINRFTISGEGFVDIGTCTTSPQAWGITVASDQGTFGNEPAIASAEASACGDIECSASGTETLLTLSPLVPPSAPPTQPVVTPTSSPVPGGTATP
jgi:hypothetical protein